MISGSHEFEAHLLDAGIKDEGIHHEFVKGQHGEKLDFDVVKPGTTLWDEWVYMNCQMITSINHPDETPFLIPIASGTIEVTQDIATELNRHGCFDDPVIVVPTEKIIPEEGDKIVRLTEEAKKILTFNGFKFGVEIDDAGTTGSSTAQPIPKLFEFGVKDIKVVYSWLRKLYLPFLEDLRIKTYGIIDNHPLPDYTPDDCKGIGLCAVEGNRCIPYGSS